MSKINTLDVDAAFDDARGALDSSSVATRVSHSGRPSARNGAYLINEYLLCLKQQPPAPADDDDNSPNPTVKIVEPAIKETLRSLQPDFDNLVARSQFLENTLNEIAKTHAFVFGTSSCY